MTAMKFMQCFNCEVNKETPDFKDYCCAECCVLHPGKMISVWNDGIFTEVCKWRSNEVMFTIKEKFGSKAPKFIYDDSEAYEYLKSIGMCE